MFRRLENIHVYVVAVKYYAGIGFAFILIPDHQMSSKLTWEDSSLGLLIRDWDLASGDSKTQTSADLAPSWYVHIEKNFLVKCDYR